RFSAGGKAGEEQTPLHIASRLGKTEIVQLLLQHMAHPDAATTNGYTPLHISAREGQVDVASVLLEAGASHSMSTKVRQNQGVTPLHLASQEGHTDMVTLLLEKGSNIHVATKVQTGDKVLCMGLYHKIQRESKECNSHGLR
uniref:Uncharacterized protein n=1 Tax=Amazona collaria TaxID=241587 RepID=A0A8B9FV63_9PSIT